MSDKNLRNKIIRLAKTHPELRPDLLPLLEKEAAPQFSIEAYKKKILGEADNFIKMNSKQRKQWKESYASVLTLYNVTFDEGQKERISDILRDLKSNALPFINGELKNIQSDIRSISRLKVGDVESTRSIVKGLKSRKVRNAAMYYLKNPKLW